MLDQCEVYISANCSKNDFVFCVTRELDRRWIKDLRVGFKVICPNGDWIRGGVG